MYEQKIKKMKFYAVNDIMSMHKFAYYGETESFKTLVTNNRVIDDFLNTIYFCINEGCKRNFKFAEYIHNNFKFYSNDHKKSITATYLKKGKYDKTLYIDKYNYSLYGGFSRSSLENLFQYKELENILSYVINLNEWSEYKDKIKNPHKFSVSKLVNNLKLDNLFKIEEETKEITPYSWLPLYRHITLKEEFDVNIFKYNTDENIEYHIKNIEQEFLNVYIDLNYKEDYILKNNEISEYNIYKDIRFAILGYEKNIKLNLCISKFVEVHPIESLNIVKKHKPFLKLNGLFPLENIIEKYIDINENYKYNILYSRIKYYSFNFELIEYLDDFVEYSLIEAVILSCNHGAYEQLKKHYEKHQKCYKILDMKNEKYINSKENIKLDFKEIKKKMKFNKNEYKNNYYIIN